MGKFEYFDSDQVRTKNIIQNYHFQLYSLFKSNSFCYFTLFLSKNLYIEHFSTLQWPRNLGVFSKVFKNIR